MGHVLATWYMMSGTCLAMGLVHVVVWLRRWREPHMLMFSVSAIAIAGLAVSEAGMMAAASIEEMVRWLRTCRYSSCSPAWSPSCSFSSARDDYRCTQ